MGLSVTESLCINLWVSCHTLYKFRVNRLNSSRDAQIAKTSALTDGQAGLQTQTRKQICFPLSKM